MSQHIDPMPKQTTLDTIVEDIETYRPITSYTTLADIKSMLNTLIGTMAGSQTKHVLFTTGTDTSLAPFKSWGNYSGYVTKVNITGTYWVGHFIGIDGNDVEIGCNNGTITAYSLNDHSARKVHLDGGSSDWATNYAIINALGNQETATAFLTGSAASYITNGAITGNSVGTLTKTHSESYDFILVNGAINLFTGRIACSSSGITDRTINNCAKWVNIGSYYGYESNSTGSTKNRIIVNPVTNLLCLTVNGSDTYFKLTPYTP